MLNIPSEVKTKFKSDICRKELKIVVNGVTCTNEDIYKDSFKLTEAVMDGKVEFVGCIASILEAKISTLKLPKADYHGYPINVSVAVYLDNNTLSSYIPLFNGTVDSCEKSADGHWQTLTCYDILAYFSDTPAYNEYKAAFNGGTVTLEDFRGSVMGDLGINEETQTLPNDAVKFRKRYRNKDLTAMSLIRHITQINGAFGIINRSGNFEYRWIDDGAAPEDVPYYRSLEYSDQTITPINTGLNIRTNTNDAGITVTKAEYQQYVGTDPGWSDESTDTYLVDDDDEDITEGNYVIESNLIAYKLNKNKKKVIAANIMAKVGFDAVFRNYKVVCNGLPYVECCDKVRFTKADGSQIGFVVLKRTLQGVQNMTDTYECAPTQETVQTGSGVSSTASSYVSNVANSTLGMSGSPDEALGLIEKSITVNGTYAATEDGAEGFSQVEVNVEGGAAEYYTSESLNNCPNWALLWRLVNYNNKIVAPDPNGGGYVYELTDSGWSPVSVASSYAVKLAVVFNNKIHCFYTKSGDIAGHISYDGSEYNITAYNDAPFKCDNPYLTHRYQAFVFNNKLYIWGYRSNGNQVVLRWDDANDTWTLLRTISSGSAWDFYTPTCEVDGNIYIARFTNNAQTFDQYVSIWRFIGGNDNTWTEAESYPFYDVGTVPGDPFSLIHDGEHFHIIGALGRHVVLMGNNLALQQTPIQVGTNHYAQVFYSPFAEVLSGSIYAGGGNTARSSLGSAVLYTYKIDKHTT